MSEILAAALAVPGLPGYLQKIERIMLACVPPGSPLSKPFRRVVQASGKRLRPSMVIAAATSQHKAVTKQVLYAAAAVELLHLSSLVHDDMLDHAELRHGVPTVHRQEGFAAGLLTGDYLFAMAAKQAAAINGEAATILIDTFALLCEGQQLESLDAYNPGRTAQVYFKTIHHKTAALFGAACQLGALSAGLSGNATRALRRYGETFGMGMQLMDDLLDIVATPAALDKPTDNDLKEGVYTLPYLLGRDGEAGPEVRAWMNKSAPQEVGQTIIIETLQACGALQATLDHAQTYFAHATQALEMLPNTAVKSALANFPQAYIAWMLKKQSVLMLQ